MTLLRKAVCTGNGGWHSLFLSGDWHSRPRVPYNVAVTQLY